MGYAQTAQLAAGVATDMVNPTPQAICCCAVTTDMEHSCGLRRDNTIICWGANDAGQSDPPEGSFHAVGRWFLPFVWAAHRWHHHLLGS